MSKHDPEQTGCLIQAYIQASWGDNPDVGMATELGARLEPKLRERIDVLGLDGEQLLDVAATEVWTRLQQLERTATREDARVVETADRIRAREVNHHDTANPARRDPGMHPGRHRQPAGHGRRRQRGQR